MIRLLLSPKWMVWHVLTLGAMVTCGWLAAWQWGRAGSAMGSALNIGYGLQWPVFAVFFGVMWFRFLRMEVRDLRAAGVGTGTAGQPTEPGPPSPTDRPDGDLPGPRTPAPAGAVPGDAGAAAADGAGPPDRPSPFTPRPAGVTAPRSTDPQLRAYNEELARLADRQEETTP